MNCWYWIGYTLSKLFCKLVLSHRVVNRERLDDLDGGVLVASNHVSFLDPPIVGVSFREAVHYFARKTLFDHPVTGFLFPRINAIPVDQAKPELSVLKKIIQLLVDGEKVVIFPEGERSPNGQIKREAQPGVGMIVSKAKVPVLPVRIFGAEKALPRGAKWVRPCRVTVVVGEPIDFTEFAADRSIPAKERYRKISQDILQAIAELELPE